MIRPLLLLAAAAPVIWLSGCATAARPAPAPQGRTLQPFRSEAELAAFHRRMQEAADRENARRMEEARRAERNRGDSGVIGHWDMHPPQPWPESVPRPPLQMERSSTLSPVGPLADELQAGGDERPTVQVHGDHLLVLRRGRLFTVRIAGGALQPVSWVDAYGYTPTGGWHDEVLASGGRAVVIGSNYGLRDTELSLFDLSPDGEPAHRDTYHLISDDEMWQSHTYAARMDGGRLVLYVTLPVQHMSPHSHRPALSAWGAPREPTAPATRVYRALGGGPPFSDYQVLHTVMACDPAGEALRCESTALYGPRARVFHVSPTAVYVWAPPNGARPAVLYRLPLDGSAPTGLQVSGRPVDPSALLESADGHVNVLLRAEPGVQGRPPGYADGPLALLRVPLAELGDGSRAAEPSRYRELPLKTPGVLRHRFVGDWLVYGTGVGAGARLGFNSEAYAVRWAGGEVSAVQLPHGADRIEALGSGAVVMGTDGRVVHLSTLRLGPDSAAFQQRVTLPGDTVHGFFYHPQGEDAGVVAVPFRGPVRDGVEGLLLGADRIRFLRSRGLRLEEMGELSAGGFGGDDPCVTSCLNWYGDTRPVFAGGRILALLGYELVEAVEEDGRLREVRRVSFAPPHPARSYPTGDWTLTETIGERGGRYFCGSRGELRLARDSAGQTVRLHRTGECVVGGSAADNRWEGAGKAELSWTGARLEVDTCVYEGRLRTPDHLRGKVSCRVQLADGTSIPVTGRWEARRAGPSPGP